MYPVSPRVKCHMTATALNVKNILHEAVDFKVIFSQFHYKYVIDNSTFFPGNPLLVSRFLCFCIAVFIWDMYLSVSKEFIVFSKDTCL